MAAPSIDDVLAAANSSDPQAVTWATETLSHWERQPGYYTSLLDVVFSQRSDAIRLVAAVQFKNGVGKYWRLGHQGALSQEEKAGIRARIMDALGDSFIPVVLQMNEAIARIARLDVPRHWPELPSLLCKTIQSSPGQTQSNALQCLYRVCKAMSSKRLMNARKVFEQLAVDIFPFCLKLWKDTVAQTLPAVTQSISSAHASSSVDYGAVIASLERSRLLLKLQRQLLVHGMPNFSASTVGPQFLEQVSQCISSLLAAGEATHFDEAHPLAEALGKHLTMLAKTLLNAQGHHPLAFAPFVPAFVSQLRAPAITPPAQAGHPRFRALCLQLFRQILTTSSYEDISPEDALKSSTPSSIRSAVASGTSSPGKTDVAAAMSQARHIVYGQCFTPDTQTEMARELVDNLLCINQQELEEWADDPVKFATEEMGDSWQLFPKPSAEKLFQTLVAKNQEVMCPMCASFVPSLMSVEALGAQQELVRIEAAMHALSLTAYELFDYADISPVVAHMAKLVDNGAFRQCPPLMQNGPSNDNIVLRQLCQLASAWVNVKLSREARQLVYQILETILAPGNDLVVRLVAAQTVSTLVKDFDFIKEDFHPHVPGIFGCLFDLLVSTPECETKMTVLDTVRTVIDVLGNKVTIHAAGIANALPRLWQDAAGHALLQTSIVETLTRFIEALAAQSQGIQEFVAPIVFAATELDSEVSVYLLDHALELWHVLLQCAPAANETLMHLFQRLPPLLERGDEYLRTCLKIAESYVLLGAVESLPSCLPTLVAATSSLLPDVPNAGIGLVARVIDTLLVTSPDKAFQAYFESLIVPSVVRTCSQRDSAPLFTAFAGVITRALVAQPQGFVMALQKASQQAQQDLSQQVFSVIMDRYDSVSSPKTRKLIPLALLHALTVPDLQAILVPKFGLMMNTVVEALHQFHISMGRLQDKDYFVREDAMPGYVEPEAQEHGSPGGLGDETPAAELGRKRRAARMDVIYTQSLRHRTREVLGQLEHKNAAAFAQLMSGVDVAIATQLKDFISDI